MPLTTVIDGTSVPGATVVHSSGTSTDSASSLQSGGMLNETPLEGAPSPLLAEPAFPTSTSTAPSPSVSQDRLPLAGASCPGVQNILPTTEPPTSDDIPSPEIDLPPEVAGADISIAPNGSFVETSSGAAARELKRRYDQYIGVGKDIRSPYAITAFINQHGKQMYRVGLRELSAPAASAEDAEQRVSRQYTSTRDSRQSYSHSQQARRRSRMSVHSFLPASVFKNGTMSVSHNASTPDGTRSPPTRKLRKTRSIPNQLGGESDRPAQPASQAQSTGRPHAHSVSSADAFRPPSSIAAEPSQTTQREIFADVMSWPQGPSLASSSASSSRRSLQLSNDHSHAGPSNQDGASEIIVQPFGQGVSFDSPSWRSPSHLSSPPGLREMQSFESGLTARADYQGRLTRGVSSAIHLPLDVGQTLPEGRTSVFVSTQDATRTGLTPRDETIMHSPYSTEVFDVLQTSRGLPSLDRISSTSQETTIKLSLKADDTAAPRDDPRFVIWGDVQADEQEDVPQASMTDLSSVSSGVSRKKSLKAKRATASPEADPSGGSSREGPMKMLVAATIERWIAQLTSELNYDELLVFFLTYRTYISALDLGHLLICRFHWALGEPTSPRDEMVRRIVRVRTFTAMRYWVVTFFDADFVPNRDLRLLFANWLNSLGRDPVLQRHKDALKIVRQLRKVFLECKDGHLRRIMKQTGKKNEHPRSHVPTLENAPDARLAGKWSLDNGSEDFDIDLDFDIGLTNGGHTLGADASSPKRTSGPLDLSQLRQPLQLAFLQYGKKSSAFVQSSAIPTPVLLPVPHSTLSRVLVNTIGRLGRWKRVLNSRTPGRTPLTEGIDVSAFDVEASETGDLLLVRGGVEQYLKMVEDQMAQATLAEGIRRTEDSSSLASTQGTDATAIGDEYEQSQLFEASSADRATMNTDDVEPVRLSTTMVNSDASSSRHVSTSTACSDQRESLKTLSRGTTQSMFSQQLEIVSIDDLDLSDLSSDESVEFAPPGLKRPPRRLPTRRDFEFVRQSTDSVSSMGIRTRESMMSGGSNSSTGLDLGVTIHQWQVNALVDSLSDEEEAGDVEAALRRLEGQISVDKQRAKQSKVDRWVQSIQQRRTAGHLGTESVDVSSDEEDYGEIRRPTTSRSPSRASVSRASDRSSSGSANPPMPPGIEPHSDTRPMNQSSLSDAGLLVPSGEAKPAVEDAVPLEILQSRVESTPPTKPPAQSAGTYTIGPVLNMKRHHSFILGYRVETLMQHFCMIDRELFLNIRFEELVTPHMIGTAQDTNILDWALFLRERARLKAEGRIGHQTGSLTVVRGRFNLIANFVLSEIVLTHPSERMRIFTKFIRLAWKAYELKNFNTLVAMVAGLRSHWVSKALQQCADRPRLNDKRILDDLTSWTTKTGHFMYIRQTVEALSEAKPIEVNSQDVSAASTDGQSSRSRAASESKPQSAPACVPFFGVYLSQLQRYTDLPDLIDPTAPHEPVGIDPISNTFEALAHPEVFSTLAPLPPSIQLEPLINVHKQRLVAAIVKSFVAAQHLASRVQYPLDKKLFQRCLKLRGLDTDTLERALTLYADSR